MERANADEHFWICEHGIWHEEQFDLLRQWALQNAIKSYKHFSIWMLELTAMIQFLKMTLCWWHLDGIITSESQSHESTRLWKKGTNGLVQGSVRIAWPNSMSGTAALAVYSSVRSYSDVFLHTIHKCSGCGSRFMFYDFFWGQGLHCCHRSLLSLSRCWRILLCDQKRCTLKEKKTFINHKKQKLTQISSAWRTF